MRRVKRIGIIGHFAFGHHFVDGQTVKTKTLYECLKESYKNTPDIHAKFHCVDTYNNKTNKIKLLFDTFICILKSKTIILLLSGNGMKFYFPIMYVLKRFFKKQIFHDVIGGDLPEFIDRHPDYLKYFNAIDENWIEFDKLKQKLNEIGLTNCRVIPNFKNLDVNTALLHISEDRKSTFCMFSRVMEEKGVTDAILAVNKYNQSHSEKIFLEIWGPIEEEYKNKFMHLLHDYKSDVNYNGVVNFDKSVETISNHLALLFPTYWDGEGFPGTIIDAYASGLPVIASDWNANCELIDDFQTGFVYPNTQISNLYEALVWSMDNREMLLQMRMNCINKAKEYMPDRWIPQIINIINN